MLLFLTTNMAAVTSLANQQFLIMMLDAWKRRAVLILIFILKCLNKQQIILSIIIAVLKMDGSYFCWSNAMINNSTKLYNQGLVV